MDSQYNNAVRYICSKYKVNAINQNMQDQVVDNMDKQLILGLQAYHLASFDKKYFDLWFVNNFKTTN